MGSWLGKYVRSEQQKTIAQASIYEQFSIRFEPIINTVWKILLTRSYYRIDLVVPNKYLQE